MYDQIRVPRRNEMAPLCEALRTVITPHVSRLHMVTLSRNLHGSSVHTHLSGTIRKILFHDLKISNNFDRSWG